MTLRAHTPVSKEIRDDERKLADNKDDWELKDKKNRAIVLL